MPRPRQMISACDSIATYVATWKIESSRGWKPPTAKCVVRYAAEK